MTHFDKSNQSGAMFIKVRADKDTNTEGVEMRDEFLPAISATLTNTANILRAVTTRAETDSKRRQ